MKRDRKDAMIRLGVVDDHVAPDFEGMQAGRGAYLHRSDECLERFVKSKAKPFRSLRRRIDRSERIEIARTIKERLDRESRVE
jgi:predicted RNA-binding protein YlxR (DUF448 family)